VDYIADKIMVFSGEPGVSGAGHKPEDLRAGMNVFLKGMDMTFRRDEETRRPRANKPGSQKDKEQRAKGEYYYS
jgi:ATP-binding cassette subfamily E protein 1